MMRVLSNCATIHVLIIGVEEFSKDEVTDVFFASTKLFQSSDVHLRRLTYLVIKELHIGREESFICIASLNKDMTSKIELFRANSIRVLSKIMEGSMVHTNTHCLLADS
jgi:coatomer protein complex subunit gamma